MDFPRREGWKLVDTRRSPRSGLKDVQFRHNDVLHTCRSSNEKYMYDAYNKAHPVEECYVKVDK